MKNTGTDKVSFSVGGASYDGPSVNEEEDISMEDMNKYLLKAVGEGSLNLSALCPGLDSWSLQHNASELHAALNSGFKSATSNAPDPNLSPGLMPMNVGMQNSEPNPDMIAENAGESSEINRASETQSLGEYGSPSFDSSQDINQMASQGRFPLRNPSMTPSMFPEQSIPGQNGNPSEAIYHGPGMLQDQSQMLVQNQNGDSSQSQNVAMDPTHSLDLEMIERIAKLPPG